MKKTEHVSEVITNQ